MRHAFTLLELLCAVAIIALLASLVLPLLGTVRSVARQAACAANLRQVGLLQFAYAEGHGGTLTPAYLRPNMDWLAPGLGWPDNERAIYGIHGRVWGDCWEGWYLWLARDLGMDYVNPWGQAESFNNHLTCPDAPNRPPRGQDLSSSTHWYGGNSYGMNTAVLGDTGATGANQWGFPNQSRPTTGWPGYGVGIAGLTDNRRRLARVARPSDVILIAEHRGSQHGLLGGSDAPFAYWSEAPFVRPPVDGAGVELTPPASWGTWTSAFGWRDDGGRMLAVRVSHRGRSNYLFHDGRVAALTPWDTCSADPSLPNLWTGNPP